MNRPFATSLVPLAWLALAVLPADSFGQSRSMFGNSTSSATSMGRSSNSPGFSGLTGSSTGRGQMGTGQTGFGSTGMGQQTQFGATTGQRQGLLGGGNQAGRLIGANQGTGGQPGGLQGNQFGGGNLGLGNLGRRGNTGRGGLNQGGFGGGGFGGGGFGGQGGMSATAARYPTPQLKVGFEPVAPAPLALSTAVNTRIARIDTLHGLSAVTATADESSAGTVVLSGTVRTEQERKKAEHLVRFEPGVRNVRNEIVVAPSPVE